MERDEAYWLRGTITLLEAQVDGLNYELHMRDVQLAEKDKYIAELEQRIEEFKEQATLKPEAPPLPSFVKPNLPKRRRRKRPGRKEGHAPALRPLPRKIDRHQDVPLKKDDRHHPICPHCACRLKQLRRHKRLVEELIRSTVQTTCYHTHSGLCPHCGRRVESRDPEQPPAVNLPHAQLGLNALVTAAILRVRHRFVPPDRAVALGPAGAAGLGRRDRQADQTPGPLAGGQVPGPDPPHAGQRSRACRRDRLAHRRPQLLAVGLHRPDLHALPRR